MLQSKSKDHYLFSRPTPFISRLFKIKFSTFLSLALLTFFAFNLQISAQEKEQSFLSSLADTVITFVKGDKTTKDNTESFTSTTVNFENFTAGTVNGQGGWSSLGAAGSGCAVYDHTIANNTSAPASFGAKSLRMSNAVTSGCFADHTFSVSLPNEAGETSAQNNGLSGGTRQKKFYAEWEFISADPNNVQDGLSVVTSPDRGDGARMSWVQMLDTTGGININFNDFNHSANSFVQTTIASGLNRTVPHTIRIEMEFVDGIANDIVKVYIDGALRHTGTSWEDYFRDVEGNPTKTVDSVLFRTGGAAVPSTLGKGFLIDNFTFGTSTPTTTVVNPASLQGWAFFNEGLNGSGSFVTGPATAPLGNGSARLTVDSNGRQSFGTLAYAGTRLDQITQLSYSSYQNNNVVSPVVAISLQFGMDFDLTDGDTSFQGRLVFEPYQNATVQQNVWQTWSPLAGKFWATRAPFNATCPQSNPCTWSQILAAYPNAGIHSNTSSGFGILLFRAGGPVAGGFDGNVDNFTFGVNSTATTFNFEPTATVVVDDDGQASATDCDASIPASSTIQGGINAANIGDTVKVCPGTYNEDVIVNKALSLNGAGVDVSTVVGLKTGSNSNTLTIAASGVTVDGFTITRDGNNTTDWNTNVKNQGVLFNQGISGSTLQNSKVTGNRNGVYINNAQGNSLRRNVIDFNRTGIQFANDVSNTLVEENFITNNWTLGILFNFDSPTLLTSGVTIRNNSISGNWYGEVVNRYANSTANLNLSGNWFGTANVTTTTSNSSEPGYAGLIPTAYGGTASAPGGQLIIGGASSAKIDFSPYLDSGADTNGTTAGFQGDYSVVQANAASPQAVAGVGSIEEAVNSVTANGSVRVHAGTYPMLSTANVNKSNVTIIGVDATRPLIQIPTSVGYGFNVGAPNVTLDNLEIQKTDLGSPHNMILVLGNNFRAQNNLIYGPNPGSEWSVNGLVSRAFEVGGGLTGLLFQNNTIHTLRQPAYINASSGQVLNNNVSGTRGWVIDGGNITFNGNTFGEPQNQGCDIALLPSVNPANYPNLLALSTSNDNGFICAQFTGGANGRATAYVDATPSAGNGSDNSNYTTITEGANGALPGGTVQVAAGVYPENVATNKPLNFVGPQAGVDARTGRTDLNAEAVVGISSGAFTITPTSGTVKIDGFTLTGATANADTPAIYLVGSSNHQVINNVIQGNSRGAYHGSPGTLFKHNRLNNTLDGFFGGVDNVTIEENLFTGGHSSGAVNTTVSSGDPTIDNFRIINNSSLGSGNFAVVFATSGGIISGNTVANTTGTAMFIGGGNTNLTIQNNTMTGIQFAAFNVNDAGFGYGNNSNITISGNTVTRSITAASNLFSTIDLRGVAGNNQITNNRLTLGLAPGAPAGTSGYALRLRGSGSGSFTISGNYFDGAGLIATPVTNSPPTAGIYITSNVAGSGTNFGQFPATAVINASCNTFTNFQEGITVFDNVANTAGGLLTGTDVNVNNNNFLNNSVYGINNNGASETIDGENNFWRTANGPSGAGPGSGDAVSNNVDFTPFLTAATNCAPATPLSISGNIVSNSLPLNGVTVTLNGSQTATTTTDASGNFTFPNLSSGGNYLVTPTLSGYTFEPTYRSYSNLSTSVTNANFVGLTSASPRVLSIGTANVTPGQNVTVPVTIVSQGNENSIGFSVNYNSAILFNPVASLGNDAGGGSIIYNSSTAGQLGVIMALAPGQTFTAGTRQAVKLTFSTMATTANSTPLTFSDTPVLRQIANANSDPLPASYTNGSITFAQGYESDVAPRPNGSGTGVITVADYTQTGRFAAALDTADSNSSNEFQRADAAPRGTKGDGLITVTDYTQAGRYAAGLDAVQTAGGPLVANLFEYATRFEQKQDAMNEKLLPRILRVVSQQTNRGQQVVVPISIDAEGDENGFGFTLSYDPAVLSNPSVQLGVDLPGGTFFQNTNLPGKVGVIAAAPIGQAVLAGTRQIVTIRFDVAANAPGGATPLLMVGHPPVVNEVSSVNADVLPTTFTGGFVNILIPTASNATVSGRVADVNGTPIPRVRVLLTDSSGASRTAVTNNFGMFVIEDVPTGATYVLNAVAKGYTFTPQAVDVSQDISDLNLIGEQ